MLDILTGDVKECYVVSVYLHVGRCGTLDWEAALVALTADVQARA